MAELGGVMGEAGPAYGDGGEVGPDPAEQEAIARHLADELTGSFVAYVRGELAFADLTFHAYEVLENLHAVGLGDYELEYEDGPADSPRDAADYDRAGATEEQEDLAQEPARDGD